MRKPQRSVEIFSLSALDVLAMSTGAFVVLLTLLMPYYQMTAKAGAAIPEVREDIFEAQAEREELEAKAALFAQGAARLGDELEELEAEMVAVEGRIAAAQGRIQALQARPVPPPETGGPSVREEPERRVVDRQLDLVFVIDITHSMRPVLRDLSQSMAGIVRVLERLIPSLRVGVVAYSDTDTGYVPVHALNMTDTASGLPRILRFVDQLRPPPRGSRTIEEDMHLGIERALAMSWRPGARQVMIVMGDARARPRLQARLLGQVRAFANGGRMRAVSALFVSTPNSRRRGDLDAGFFQELAQAGRGTFTRHSGEILESVIMSVLVN